MKGSQFDILAALVLSEEASEKQKIEFEELLKASKENQAIYEKLKRVWHTNLAKSDGSSLNRREHLWQGYQRERNLQKKKVGNFFGRAAACLFLLIAAGSSFYLYTRQIAGEIQEHIVSATEVLKETNPGEKLKTRLPDGTMVILNAGSKLIYPEHFDDSVRLVQLIGEGYFDVAEDKQRPFTVRIQSMDVTALGTAFGVNAYPKNATDLVALVSGKLLIRNQSNNEIQIDSGQAVALSRAGNQFSKSSIDYLAQVAWKDGILHFSNNRFDEIVQALELNYGVEFLVDKHGLNLAQDTYSGTFKNENLDNVLKVLAFSMNFKYEINGKEVLIKKK